MNKKFSSADEIRKAIADINSQDFELKKQCAELKQKIGVLSQEKNKLENLIPRCESSLHFTINPENKNSHLRIQCNKQKTRCIECHNQAVTQAEKTQFLIDVPKNTYCESELHPALWAVVNDHICSMNEDEDGAITKKWFCPRHCPQ